MLDDERDFIKTKCNHNVCLDCFKELINNKQYKNCPVCRKTDWIIPIDKKVY